LILFNEISLPVYYNDITFTYTFSHSLNISLQIKQALNVAELFQAFLVSFPFYRRLHSLILSVASRFVSRSLHSFGFLSCPFKRTIYSSEWCCFLVQRTVLNTYTYTHTHTHTHARARAAFPLLFFSRLSGWKLSAHGRDRSTCTDLHISRGLFESRRCSCSRTS